MDERPPQRLLDTPSWLLTQIATDAGRRTREVFEDLGAGRYHYAILCAAEEFGPCSQADIGRRLQIDRKDVANRVLELEKEGCLERRSDPEDPRRNLVRLTTQGEARLIQIQDRLREAQDDLLAKLEPANRATFIAALQTILDR